MFLQPTYKKFCNIIGFTRNTFSLIFSGVWIPISVHSVLDFLILLFVLFPPTPTAPADESWRAAWLFEHPTSPLRPGDNTTFFTTRFAARILLVTTSPLLCHHVIMKHSNGISVLIWFEIKFYRFENLNSIIVGRSLHLSLQTVLLAQRHPRILLPLIPDDFLIDLYPKSLRITSLFGSFFIHMNLHQGKYIIGGLSRFFNWFLTSKFQFEHFATIERKAEIFLIVRFSPSKINFKETETADFFPGARSFFLKGRFFLPQPSPARSIWAHNHAMQRHFL